MAILAAYFSTVKIVVIMVALLPWLYTATWMNKDTRKVHSVGPFWCGLALGLGVLGLVVLLAVSMFAIGFPIYLLLTGGIIGTYVVYRNKRVVPEARVLTGEHIKKVFSRTTGADAVKVVERVKLYDSDGKAVFPPPEEDTAACKAYNGAQELLSDVVKMRASEVDLSPTGPQTGVRYIIDGVLQNRPPLDRQLAETVMDYIKDLAGMNVEDRRRPQTGHMSVDMGAVRADIKVSAAGTTHGQRMQLRVLQEAVQTRLEELGMSETLQTRLIELNAAGTGLIIVAAPKGNGMTSTLYSLLRKHDAFMKQLVTLETLPSTDMENITQNRYGDPKEMTRQLARLIRQDPDVLMVDQCPSQETARIVCDVAATKGVLLGMIGNSTFVALAKWLKVCGGDRAARKMALGNLQAVVCQKLLRNICPACKEGYTPSKERLAKLNLPPEKISQFYRPPKELTDEKGRPIICPTCGGTGYMGRTAAFELLEISDEVRELVVSSASLDQIQAACRRAGMLYLQEQALRKVIEGVTSIEEVIRVSKAK